jgi:hypothetical protein
LLIIFQASANNIIGNPILFSQVLYSTLTDEECKPYKFERSFDFISYNLLIEIRGLNFDKDIQKT